MISSSTVAHCVWGFFSNRLIDSTGRRGTFQRCVIVRPSLRESSYGVWASIFIYSMSMVGIDIE